MNSERLQWLLVVFWIVSSYWTPFGTSFRALSVEFREHGILSEVFWPWEKIRESRWTEGGSTLVLKTEHAVLTYYLRADDREAVEAVLKTHVAQSDVPS